MNHLFRNIIKMGANEVKNNNKCRIGVKKQKKKITEL